MIAGFFDSARGPHPYITLAVNVPLVTADRWVGLTFLVDTGASHTCIHPLDGIRSLGLQPVQLVNPALWTKTVQSGGVGGGATYFEVPARYGFISEDSSVEIIDGEIWIGQLTPTNQWMPSLLGWDLLKNFRLEVHGGDQKMGLHRL